LQQAGLKRVTVSLDSLDDSVFKAMNGADVSSHAVLEGIAAAAAAGFDPIKINAVVQRGVNDHTILDLARRFQGTGHVVRFIEYLDVGTTNGWRLDQVVTARQIVEIINAEMPIEPVEPKYSGEVAQRWRYLDGSGEIGVIASVSEPFCATCTRARLSPDGKLYTCLFASMGHDVKALINAGVSDDQIAQFISQVWARRDDQYSQIRSDQTVSKSRVEMSYIGG